MRTSSKWIAAMAIGMSMLSAGAYAGAPRMAATSTGAGESAGAAAAKRIHMGGDGFSYTLHDGVASVQLPNIVNENSGDMSAVMRLELWATPIIPNAGARITGVRVATFATITSLDPFSTFQQIEQSAPYQAPPPGTYTMVLALLQGGMAECGSDDGFCLVDSFVAPAPETFGNNNYSDLWYNPQDTGWGLSVTQRGATAFVVIYLYDEAGNPKWYVASNLAQSGETFSGLLYETHNGSSPSEVGSVTLAFDGANSGTLAYTVRGETTTRSIARQLF